MSRPTRGSFAPPPARPARPGEDADSLGCGSAALSLQVRTSSRRAKESRDSGRAGRRGAGHQPAVRGSSSLPTSRAAGHGCDCALAALCAAPDPETNHRVHRAHRGAHRDQLSPSSPSTFSRSHASRSGPDRAGRSARACARRASERRRGRAAWWVSVGSSVGSVSSVVCSWVGSGDARSAAQAPSHRCPAADLWDTTRRGRLRVAAGAGELQLPRQQEMSRRCG